MTVSREISADIIKYLRKKGLSVDEIADSMSTSSESIQLVIKRKSSLKQEHIDAYIKKQNLKFWEFALEAISMEHLSPLARKRIQICKELSDRIKNKK